MRKPQPKILPVIKIPLGEHDHEVIFTVLFFDTMNACFSLHEMPDLEPGKRGGPIMLVDDCDHLHCRLLIEPYVGPGVQFAFLVHELGGVDHKPEGRVILNLLGHRGSLKNGCITIDIPRGQVAAGYIEFVAKWQGGDEEGDEVDDEDEEV
jgi:hypothetical protein